jgi:hypothetical protein
MLNRRSDILEQYFVGLRVKFETVKEQNPDVPAERLEKIQALFDNTKKTWTNAYEIDQHLAHICDELTLDVELKGKLIEYQRHFDTISYQHYMEEIDKIDKADSSTSSTQTKRSILLRLISELQWFYTKREVSREYSLLTRMHTSIVFLFSFIIFSLSLVLCVTLNCLDFTTKVLVIATCAGLLGASFSMLTRLRSQLKESSINDLKLLHRMGYIILRPSIGVGAALIFFFLIQSGLLDGSIFPKLPLAGMGNEVYKSYRDISLVIVWSFIAGFSEQFVPQALVPFNSKRMGWRRLLPRISPAL